MNSQEHLDSGVLYTEEELRALYALNGGRTDWSKVDSIPNDEIDDSDIPDDFWETALVVYPKPKRAISLRVDEGLLAWYKNKAAAMKVRGYQSFMHSVLQGYRAAEEKRETGEDGRS